MSTLAISSLIISVPYLGMWPRVIQLWKTSHSQTNRLGIVVMIGLLGCFQFAQYYLAWFGWDKSSLGVAVNSGSSILFPLSLAIVMHLYITGSAKVFRSVCILLLTTNLVALGFACMMCFGWGPALSPRYAALWTVAAIVKIALGSLIFCVDIMLMVGSYKRFWALATSRYSRVSMPLLAALSLDSLLFSGVVAYCDRVAYLPTLEIQLLTKLAAGCIYAACLTLAFRQFDMKAFDCPSGSASEFWREVIPRRGTRRVRVDDLTAKDLTARPDSVTDRGMNLVGTDAPSPDAKRRAQDVLRRDRSRLLEDYVGKWVAVDPSGVIASADSDRQLTAQLSTLPIDPANYIIRMIVPWMDEASEAVAPTPDIVEASPRSDSPDPIRRAEAAMSRSWGKLVESKTGRWAAFDENGIVADCNTQGELLKLLAIMNRDDVVVRQIEHAPNSATRR